MEELRLYTVKDLKYWVLDGKPKDGLSEAVITPTRAHSFIHNPYVTDDMQVVSALFADGELAAFTAAFPERLARPECLTHWVNSLYVSPKYEGKGYAFIVMGSLLECFEGGTVFDLDAMETSVEIFKYMGIGATTFTRYCFREKSISTSTVGGKMLGLWENRKRRRKRKNMESRLGKELSGMEYRLNYDNFVDKEAYDFIEAHSEGDMFLRRQETLNWMLRYPFVHEAPIIEKTLSKNLFSSSKKLQHYYVVKLFIADKLAAVYILHSSTTGLSLDYFYYDKQHEQTVFLSVIEHILRMENNKFTTTHPRLAETIRQWNIYPVLYLETPSLCYSKEYEQQICLHIQGGDGDMILS